MVKIKWIERKEDFEYIESLIRNLGYDILADRTFKVKREDFIRFKNKLNELIEKYIKTDVRIDLPILKKEDDDIAWCEVRINRNVNLGYLK